ncbi:uncharacterized protein VDAG_01150 [Verticillium dahliae VdLs.17]|uniref:LYR motif-containing protein 2 n=1 Tax=Verticillium dahliae (strain VdLs.17 / ATCC MYA-4575 / FGSC 10137) TaxID=498257 RepID=G2WTM7_VERDV|nr:uncharacterized protein VDAG_01150 [Verticillium dahliae VdLs.17]EGY17468.1 hypothetical protein VDAG_01150 [Verticillium dahliae VdLs.17]KAH6665069.1 hypothetical protein EV126DRAFT_352265 [Verticillium dahliae]KAH6691069.1 hypothetical protein EV126DRAFT_445299 [Verticillium dahliae]
MKPTLGRWWLAARGYSTAAPAKTRLKKTLSLDHFLQRGRVLSLYRTILRGTAHISDPSTKAESRRYARGEFERHRHVTDIVRLHHERARLLDSVNLRLNPQGHIRYLLSTGKVEWDSMGRYVEGL